MPPSSTAVNGDGAANTYTATAELRHSIRPLSSFLNISAISLPLSISDLTLRFNNNLHTFRTNYVIISILIFILTLILRPSIAIIFVLLIGAWIYFFVARDEPIEVFGFEIGDRMVLIALSVITVVVVAVASVWWNLFVSVVISALVVSLHAILMSSDGEESPYGALLGDEDGGSYVPV